MIICLHSFVIFIRGFDSVLQGQAAFGKYYILYGKKTKINSVKQGHIKISIGPNTLRLAVLRVTSTNSWRDRQTRHMALQKKNSPNLFREP
jgi:hypothetical protein